MAASGSMPRRAATKPHNTSAKNGKVTHKMFSTRALCQAGAAMDGANWTAAQR
jgi:hypothetical protein